jgi:hypothetical protein
VAVGPFDSDSAADWSLDLQVAKESERVALIRKTLRRVAEERDYVDSVEAAQAIAAAAVVAAQLPGAEPPTSPNAPDFVREGGRVEIAPDLCELAVRALDRVLDGDSEWRELWEDAAEVDTSTAMEMISGLRTGLAQAG